MRKTELRIRMRPRRKRQHEDAGPAQPSTVDAPQQIADAALQAQAKRRRLLCKQTVKDVDAYIVPHGGNAEHGDIGDLPDAHVDDTGNVERGNVGDLADADEEVELIGAVHVPVDDAGNVEHGDVGDLADADEDVELIGAAPVPVPPGAYLLDAPAFDAADILGYSYQPALFDCLLYTSPSPRDYAASRMPSSA